MIPLSELSSGLGLQHLALFSGTVLVLNATPGVDMLCTLSRTLQGGPRAGLATAAGIVAGCLVHTLLAAFGLAALLAVAGRAFQLISWGGAAYLAWLGWGLLRTALARPGRTAAATPAGTTNARSGWADFRLGLLTNVLNPKVALFVLAFLPQFIRADAPDKTQAFLVLGIWLVLQGALFLAVLVAAVARLRGLGRRPGLQRGLQALGGGLFMALAVRLALSDLPRP
ncbi:threonine/homoserine/homoserine lactone efflux protein [Sphaerotilus hippei]|uniref:Threonine/homoserine/homoserine lactone efflux protein n=1 Tax=Sphaerotilus hippei TaxID=744406 RepID=A0A318H5L0_9BURK|nr:LysE family translocator [Sphaerotilus hippei]PXW99247.1 threonine/homoserine/homoserine lactone efflux protein [Sphaerotilus hippei]